MSGGSILTSLLGSASATLTIETLFRTNGNGNTIVGRLEARATSIPIKRFHTVSHVL